MTDSDDKAAEAAVLLGQAVTILEAWLEANPQSAGLARLFEIVTELNRRERLRCVRCSRQYDSLKSFMKSGVCMACHTDMVMYPNTCKGPLKLPSE